MKNNLFLILVAALAVGSIDSANAGKFVDVSNLGTGLVETTSNGGTNTVNATLISADQRWTRDKTYIVTKNTIIKAGVTLTIDPGTLIRCEYPTTSSFSGINPADPGALLAHRGGRFMAQGTVEAPIIVTSMDDPNVPGGISTIPAVENVGVSGANTGSSGNQRILRAGVSVNGTTISVVSGATTNNYTGTNNTTGGEYTVPDTSAVITANVRSYSLSPTNTAGNVFKWDALFGGLVTAGRANVSARLTANMNARTTAAVDGGGGGASNSDSTVCRGTEAIEGMAGYTGYTWYGGDDDLDSSGTVRFVSNRYGGFVIISGKELNGFTWCGTGTRTVSDFTESYGNADDDNEYFGGCVGSKYAIGAFSGDDGFDTDQGYCGVNQFLLQLQNSCDRSGFNTFINPSSNNYGTGTGKRYENAGDQCSENDGPENCSMTSLVIPMTVLTHANYTAIGRGYGPSGWMTSGTGSSSAPLDGPNLRDKAAAKFYNSIWMDVPHAGPTIVSTTKIDTDPSTTVNDAIYHLITTRTTGGYDGSGLADDLVTTKTDGPGEPDLTFRNCAWYRCGLAKGYASVDSNNVPGTLADATYLTGKYTYANWLTRTNDANWTIASKSNIMPEGDFNSNGRDQQGDGNLGSGSRPYNYYGVTGGWAAASTNTNTLHCVDWIIGRTNVFSTNSVTRDNSNGNAFNLNPGYSVPIDNRTDGTLDLRLGSTSDARTAVNLTGTSSSLPARGNLSQGANFLGAFCDNNWARGWTMLERAGVFSSAVGTTQIAPVVVVTVSGGKPVVNFDTVSGVKYSVEASVDNKFYRPLATVTGTGSSYPYTVNTGLNASAAQVAQYTSATTGARSTTESTYAAIPAAISATPLFFRVMAY
jgi:hypothetical protein